MKTEQVIALVVILLFVSFIAFMVIYKKDDGKKSTRSDSSSSLSSRTKVSQKTEKKVDSNPAITIDKNKTYTAVLNTSEGVIRIKLNAKETPITVNNFVTLSKKDFYDNTIFHRVIKGFMIQGGDPDGNGTGGPGYRFNDEPFEGEYTKGTIAMANAGPNTNGSQFFIMHADYPLPKNYVIFGKVIEGLDIVDKIAESPVEMSDSGEMSKPVSPVLIEDVEIVEE